MTTNTDGTAPPAPRRGKGGGERALVPDAEFRTYYDRPVLKEPVWKWEVPAYFFAGGLAAGSALLAVGAGVTGNTALARQARVTAALGATAGTALLVRDLGRPSRFHHMLRVAKPTSPMNVGSWTLAAFSTSAAIAAGSDITGVAHPVGRVAGVVAAALAPVLATYPAVLVANTAVPVWHEAHRELPFVFAGSALASAGGLAAMLHRVETGRPARRMAVLGAIVEAAAAQRMEQQLPEVVGETYKTGRASTLSKAARALTTTGAMTLARRGSRRRNAVVGGAMVLAGAAFDRFAVIEAGRASSRDPKQVVVPQRARLTAGRDGDALRGPS
jgi:formate-dependent nitrite reductase membrane component NrfD